MPERYSFNHTLGVDLIEIADAVGNKYIALNIVDMGTCFRLCEVIRSGTGQASAAQCLEVLQKRWLSWAGYPTQVVCDRGLHNRGIFERHGGILKAMIRRITGETQASGISEISTVVIEACIAKNELHRHGSYSPSQWVLGNMPSTPPTALSEQRKCSLLGNSRVVS